MTALKARSIKAIQGWCAKQKMNLISTPSHVNPRAYVIGYAAPQCLVVAEPWVDSPVTVRDWNRQNPLNTIRLFDESLRPGDWCTTAYVCRSGAGEPVAIPVVE